MNIEFKYVNLFKTYLLVIIIYFLFIPKLINSQSIFNNESLLYKSNTYGYGIYGYSKKYNIIVEDYSGLTLWNRKINVNYVKENEIVNLLNEPYDMRSGTDNNINDLYTYTSNISFHKDKIYACGLGGLLVIYDMNKKSKIAIKLDDNCIDPLSVNNNEVYFRRIKIKDDGNIFIEVYKLRYKESKVISLEMIFDYRYSTIVGTTALGNTTESDFKRIPNNNIWEEMYIILSRYYILNDKIYYLQLDRTRKGKDSWSQYPTKWSFWEYNIKDKNKRLLRNNILNAIGFWVRNEDYIIITQDEYIKQHSFINIRMIDKNKNKIKVNIYDIIASLHTGNVFCGDNFIASNVNNSKINHIILTYGTYENKLKVNYIFYDIANRNKYAVNKLNKYLSCKYNPFDNNILLCTKEIDEGHYEIYEIKGRTGSGLEIGNMKD